ncbi:hypothetical protein SEPCBS57363_003547 [Sporothrix epigloea]|uniref:DUF803 domain membrane protein n=1 Tax=Sporothrix epigloea TaxID=1892477 RepID=A0ABP0DM47_9PEZI
MYILPNAAQSLRPPSLLASTWPSFSGGNGIFPDTGVNNGTLGDGPDSDLPSNWSSLIGIVTAIVGNVLIALALNVQRYAHIRLHKEQQHNREQARKALREDTGYHSHAGQGRCRSRSSGKKRIENGGYGTVVESGSRVDGNEADDEGDADDDDRSRRAHGHESVHESSSLRAAYQRSSSRSSNGSDMDSVSDATQSTSYLRSPYWWLGQVLITIGEMGNFLAYGFAPASIVSPLGVVALISNCVIAPIFFKESFRKRDFLGVIIAIAGAVTVVLSAKQEETKLNPHDVWDAITATAFLIYVGVTCSLIMLLMWASPRYGNRTILIDLGLVGLFGGYTVLATKGVSSMLSSTLLGAFLTPMTYVLLVILLGTAVMQVRYVNKALQRFDSTQVIPIQFVMFTLSVIIGSAVLYRDFERTTTEQAVKFVGGCLLTFFGVFIITSGRPPNNDDDDDDDEETVAGSVSATTGPVESINLAEQANTGAVDAPQTPTGRTIARHSSRRSSRASRVNFIGTLTNRPVSLATDTGIPSQRTQPATPSLAPTSVHRISKSRPSSIATQDGESIEESADEFAGEFSGDYLTYKNDDADSGEDEPTQSLLENPWRGASSSTLSKHYSPHNAPMTPAGAIRPSLIPSPYSADSVLHAIGTSFGNNNAAKTYPSAPTLTNRPVTPSTALRPQSQYLHQSPMISPSPLLSSTMSAVVADTILHHLDGASPQAARRSTTRKVRCSLRSSLFVPHDELSPDEAERLLPPFSRAQSQRPHRNHQRGGSTDALPNGLGISGTDRAAAGAPASSADGALRTLHGGDKQSSLETSGGELSSASRQASSHGRSRAQSLSNALGGLFWSRRKSTVLVDEESVIAQAEYTASDNVLPPSAAVTESEADETAREQPDGFFQVRKLVERQDEQ